MAGKTRADEKSAVPAKTKADAKPSVPTRSAIAKLLEMPQSSLAPGGVRLEVHSNSEAIVEACTGVLEYTPETVRLTGGGMVLKFVGRGLAIGSMDKNGIILTGNIRSIEFIS